MPGDGRQLLRTTFDDAAERYDGARPGYPRELFDDLVELAGLSPAARLLEIGCGTGQATRALAERGYRIICVELGERLAAVARRNLVGFPDVEVVNADFETWEPEQAGFDAVVAFTAFHWIDPEVRYARTASLLDDTGVLAVVSTQHVLPPDGDAFFVEVQEDYEAVVPDDPATKAGVGGPPASETVQGLAGEIDASGRFRLLGERRYVWDVVYTADGYVDLLQTYSGHLGLDEGTRGRLLSLIRRRVEERPDAVVRKTYLATLDVARPRR